MQLQSNIFGIKFMNGWCGEVERTVKRNISVHFATAHYVCQILAPFVHSRQCQLHASFVASVKEMWQSGQYVFIERR